MQQDNKNITRIIASQEYHDVSPPASVPSSPELEPHSGLTSPQFLDNETNFAESDIDLQNYSIPMEEIFEETSPISIYKTITGEVLHVVFKGILFYISNLFFYMGCYIFFLCSQDSTMC